MHGARCGVTAVLLSMAMLLPGCATTAGQQEPELAAPVTPLDVAGATMVVELAPVLLAVRDRYPGSAVRLGGVPTLIAAERPSDVATNAETQLLRQSTRRPDLRIIMTLVEGHYRIVARRSAGITKLADLRGKRIATMRATSADYFLAKMLKHAGMTEADVTVLNVLPLQNMVTGLQKGELDAVAIWEPFSENAARAIGDDAVEFSGKGIYQELFNLNTTAGALADPAKRREIVAFMRAIIAANAKMNRDPREGQEAMAKSGNYTVEEVANSWRHHGFIAGFAPDMLDVLEEEEVWLAGQEKRAPRTREQLAPLIDRSVYEEAIAAR